jgi:tRNA(Ile)-lysidine synthase TilS/MesJ
MPSHHANFCAGCFVRFFEKAVAKAMKKFEITAATPILVAVSGGKDSLALWNVLHELGYVTQGLHVSLGIDEFSEASVEAIDQFASTRGLQWTHHSLADVFGYSIPDIRIRTRRKICSLCGLLKRQLLNRLTISEGFKVIATGHNLDDEAGRLLGNILRHRSQFFEKQYPYLPSTDPRMPSKLKPLYRLDAHEILTYTSVKSIAPLKMKCPLSRGATSHTIKHALSFLESEMPGTKRDFLFTYIDSRKPPSDRSTFGTCQQCGQATYENLCSVCNLANQLEEKQVSVES